MKHLNRDDGFTLIEVMIALFIFAISATALSSVYQQNINTAADLKERTLATWIAENKLAEMHASTAYPDAGERDERVQYAGTDWTMRIRVQPTAARNMRSVEIRVASAQGMRTGRFSATVTGYVTPIL